MACGVGSPVSAQSGGDVLCTVSPNDGVLRVVDPLTGATLSSTSMSDPTFGTPRGANGLARHPVTGELWAIMQFQGQPNRLLSRVDPGTGLLATVGNTGFAFASICFDATGTLYGVTGDGATIPETLFTLSLTTGQATQLFALGNGNNGEAIASHPDDALLYHASGNGTPEVEEIFETVDVSAQAVTNVPLSGADYDEATSIAHLIGDTFLLADLSTGLFAVSRGGVVGRIGALGHVAKGMVLVQRTGGASFRMYGDGCAATGGHVPLLLGSGTPTPGARVTLGLANGPGGALGGLAIGFGSGQLPLTAACAIQILPIAPLTLPLRLGGVGAGTGAQQLSLGIPAALMSADLFFQSGLVAGTSLVVSNPLHMHVQ